MTLNMNHDGSDDPENALLAIMVRMQEKNVVSVFSLRKEWGSVSQKEREKRDEENIFGK